MAPSNASAILIATTLLVTISGASGFVHHLQQTASALRPHSFLHGANFAEQNDDGAGAGAGVDVRQANEHVNPKAAVEAKTPGETDDENDPVAAIVGISGLAGGATVASTVATTAGGVCAGGACVAGAGALATGGAAGGAAATAGAGAGAAAAATGAGGLLAGAKAALFGGALAASVAFNGLSSGGQAATLESMVQASTPLEVAVGNGRPTVVEFYGNSCPHCHEAARQLRAVEDTVTESKGFNWVMVDTDDPRSVPLWTSYHVDVLPHFEFLDARGHEVAFEFGEVDAQRIKDNVELLATLGTDTFSSLSTASAPSK